jgi:hypothetical protein
MRTSRALTFASTISYQHWQRLFCRRALFQRQSQANCASKATYSYVISTFGFNKASGLVTEVAALARNSFNTDW